MQNEKIRQIPQREHDSIYLVHYRRHDDYSSWDETFTVKAPDKQAALDTFHSWLNQQFGVFRQSVSKPITIDNVSNLTYWDATPESIPVKTIYNYWQCPTCRKWNIGKTHHCYGIQDINPNNTAKYTTIGV